MLDKNWLDKTQKTLPFSKVSIPKSNVADGAKTMSLLGPVPPQQMQTNVQNKTNTAPVQGRNRNQTHWIKFEAGTDFPFTASAQSHKR